MGPRTLALAVIALSLTIAGCGKLPDQEPGAPQAAPLLVQSAKAAWNSGERAMYTLDLEAHIGYDGGPSPLQNISYGPLNLHLQGYVGPGLVTGQGTIQIAAQHTRKIVIDYDSHRGAFLSVVGGSSFGSPPSQQPNFSLAQSPLLSLPPAPRPTAPFSWHVNEGDTIDGTSTWNIHGTFDHQRLSAASAGTGASSGATTSVSPSTRYLTLADDSAIQIEVGRSDRLPRHLHFSFDGSTDDMKLLAGLPHIPSGVTSVSLTADIRFSGWGAAPPKFAAPSSCTALPNAFYSLLNLPLPAAPAPGKPASSPTGALDPMSALFPSSATDYCQSPAARG